MKTAADIASDPGIFLALDDLELVGKGIADSVWYGMHRSQVRGEGVEFETHREYQPGDDLRRLNWTLFARQRRLFIKESRRETQRPVYLFLDATGSMNVSHGAWSKIDYARRMLAALAFLAVRQGDSPALGIVRESLEVFLPPRSGNNQILGICTELARAESIGEGDISSGLGDGHVQCRKRGFVIFVSDFFDEEERVFSEMATFRAQGHDVLALQVLDPFEVKIPTTGDFEFVDSETGSNFRTSAEPLHEAHAQKVADWRNSLKQRAEGLGVEWESVTTDDSLVETGFRWLSDFAGVRS